MKALVVSVLVGLLLGGALLGTAAAQDVPAQQQSMLMVRILGYDRNVKRASGASVTVAVVFKPGDSSSENVKTQLVSAFEAVIATQNISGLPVKLVVVPYDSTTFEAKTAGVKAAAVYICPGLAEAVTNIVEITRRRGMLSFSNVEAQVKAGLSIGLITRNSRPTIVVNLPAARAEGSDLDSSLLRVAEVLK
jgi:hypothetical protein